MTTIVDGCDQRGGDDPADTNAALPPIAEAQPSSMPERRNNFVTTPRIF
jgi:hypothetical protein